MPILLFERGKLRGKSVKLPPGGTLKIGRESSCQIRLSGKLISRLHCRLVGKEHKWRLEDCESSNKTFINGKPVARKTLVPGDFIQVGETIFSFYGSEVDSLIGRTLKGYRIEKRIGRGGMGTVYLARQLSLQRSVALKILNKECAVKEDFVTRFLREARSAAQLNHPNVVQVYDTGREDDLYFIAMEYLPEGSLDMLLIREKKVEYPRAVELMLQTLNAVSFAEQHQIVHRDIKPGNLLFTADRHVKLADLGIAIDLKDPQQVLSGVVGGSPAYMAPEQIRKGEVDNRADIYAVGATLYHVIAGVPPFESSSIKEILVNKLKTDPEPLKSLAPSIPRQLSNAVACMMARDPAERYPTAQEAQAALKSAVKAPATAPHPRRRAASAHRRVRNKPTGKPFPVAAGLAATAVFVFIVFLIASNMMNKETPPEKEPEQTAQREQPNDKSTVGKQNPVTSPDDAFLLRQQELARKRAEEEERKQREADKRAAETEAAEIEKLIRAGDLAGASERLEGLTGNLEAVDIYSRLAALVKEKTAQLVAARRKKFEELCGSGDFAKAEAFLQEVEAQIPPAENTLLLSWRTMLSEAESKRTELLGQLASFEKNAYEKIARLDFADLTAPFDGFAADQPAYAEQAAGFARRLQGIATLWETLTAACDRQIKLRKALAASFPPTPLEKKPQAQSSYYFLQQERSLVTVCASDDRKTKLVRRILDLDDATLLSLAGSPGELTASDVKNALGWLLLLRNGPADAASLLFDQELSEALRSRNKEKAEEVKNLWLTVRCEELAQAIEAASAEKKPGGVPPETWHYLAVEAATLIKAVVSDEAAGHISLLPLLKGHFVTARTADLLSGGIADFFHAATVKQSSSGVVELSYDFASKEQMNDFVAVEKVETELQWLSDQKTMVIQGEVRFLEGMPFKEYLSVNGLVAKTSLEQPNVNIGVWTTAEDQLTPSFKNFDWRDFRNRGLGGAKPGYVVFGMGFYLNIRGGGFAGRGMDRMIGRWRNMLPAYFREASFALFAGERTKAVGGLDGELIWEMPADTMVFPPLSFAVGVKNGDITWTFKRRAVPVKNKQAQLLRLKKSLKNEGSFSLFTNSNTVFFTMLKITGVLRGEWADEQAQRVAAKELEALGAGGGESKPASSSEPSGGRGGRRGRPGSPAN